MGYLTPLFPNEQGPDITVTPEADVGSRQPSSRPKRTAAQNARVIIRVLIEDSLTDHKLNRCIIM